MKRQQIVSLLSVPILVDGRLVLQIGYDMVTRAAAWPDAEVQVLRRAGRLIALALLRTPGQTLAPIPESAGGEETLPVRQGFGIVNVPIHDLLLIRSDGDYSKVHLADGQVFYQKTTMKEWETLLRPPHFLRVHKSTIVALAKAAEIDRTGGNWTLRIRGYDEPLPVGRSYRPAVRQHLQF